MTPKGTILIIGGAEDKGGDETPEIERKNHQFRHFEILKELLPKKGHKGRIEVVTTASEVPEEVAEMYQDAFKEIGCKDVGFMHIKNKAEAREKKFADRIKSSRSVLFSGGDQLRISTVLGGTLFSDALMDKYIHDKDFVVAGTSAGAMVFSRIMICEGGTEEALIDTDLKLASGFGLLDGCIVDTHFIKRGRFSRLAHAVMINPGHLGIGLGEDTSLLVKNGKDAVCKGSGMAVIIDGKEIGQTNINEAGEGMPVFVENLKVHLLVENCRFSLADRKFFTPAISSKEKDKNAS
jgi:cyanophycinase